MTSLTRFGPLRIAAAQRWTCAGPMPGFETLHSFALLQHEGQGPFLWLQSLEEPDLAFLIAGADCFGLRYPPASRARADGDTEPCVLVIVPQRPEDTLRVHRLAPILFDARHASFVQEVFEPEQVTGTGYWTGPSGRAQSAAWLARIVHVEHAREGGVTQGAALVAGDATDRGSALGVAQ
ncbi:MAG: flagellar assembly protein FliW [Proteobacteria bacterium]|nr:flagellar assembly protein FliW [Pseudomonadota bacterium]